MIAFRAVRRRSVGPMRCGVGPLRMPAYDDERRELQPQRQIEAPLRQRTGLRVRLERMHVSVRDRAADDAAGHVDEN
jgi:hypothetical protein